MGVWSFNEKFVSKIRILTLPIEEILFFVTAPFSCIFVYECIMIFVPERIFTISPVIFYASAIAFLIISFYNRKKIYTSMVFLIFAVFIAVVTAFFGDYFSSMHFWLTMFICYIPFTIFNGLFTGIPIVLYNSEKILNIRVITIPVEDFFYNFVLLGMNFIIFNELKHLF